MLKRGDSVDDGLLTHIVYSRSGGISIMAYCMAWVPRERVDTHPTCLRCIVVLAHWKEP